MQRQVNPLPPDAIDAERKRKKRMEVALVLTVIVVFAVGMYFLLDRSNEPQNLLPAPEPVRTPEPKTKTTSASASNSMANKPAVVWISIIFGAVIVLGGILALVMRWKSNNTGKTIPEMGTSVVLKEGYSAIVEIVLALALPASMFMFAAMFSRIGWSSFRDYFLVAGILLFVWYTVMGLVYNSVYKNGMALKVLYMGLPATLLVLMGMISDRYGAKEIRDFFYFGAVGTMFFTFAYYYYVSKTKGWIDWGHERMSDAYEKVDSVRKYFTDWFYAENPEGTEQEKESFILKGVKWLGGYANYTDDEMTKLYESFVGGGSQEGMHEGSN